MQLHHIVLAGAILATGILGCWAVNMLGLTGDFVLVWKTQGIVLLAVYLLATSIVSCWLLFRVLVWKPSYEYLRPLCSVFLALSLWSVDLCECRGCFERGLFAPHVRTMSTILVGESWTEVWETKSRGRALAAFVERRLPHQNSKPLIFAKRSPRRARANTARSNDVKTGFGMSL